MRVAHSGEHTSQAAHGHFRVVAVDFDGTLTQSGRPDADLLDAVDEARRRGIRLLLVTGRILSELQSVFPEAGDYFDAIVAENGAVLSTVCGVRTLAPPVEPEVMTALAGRGVAARRGEVLVACAGADEATVLEEVRRLGLECQIIRNRSELMILPSGISKGSGLLAALGTLGLSHHNAIAIGDAENDHSLLEAAEVGVAVANAVPSLKARADLVLDRPDGAGVAGLLRGELLTDRARIQPARWRITLGSDADGALVRLPGAQMNLLIAGASGAGKSYVAGLVAEQLIGLGYSLFIVDPEGDHVGLSELEGVLVVGGDRHLPPPSAVVQLLRHRYASVVVDLSHLEADEQIHYLDGMPAEIEAVRRATGLPHWVMLDEAHLAVGRGGIALSVFDPAVKGHCLVTFHPADLSADALAGVDAMLALTSPNAESALIDITAAVADVPRASIAELLNRPEGRLVVAERANPGRAVLTLPAARPTRHVRHEHKYAMAGVDAVRRFYFRSGPDDLTGATAASLVELEIELARCPRSVLRHHCPRHDISRWVTGVFRDNVLADRLAAIEQKIGASSPAAVVEAARLDLVAELQDRALA